MDTLTHWIGGQAVAGTSGRFEDVYNPAEGSVSKRAPMASAAEVDTAVQAAAAAFPAWAAQPVLRRTRCMFRLKNLLEEHADDMARLLVAEHGKVFEDARGEVTRGIEVVEFACGAPQLLKVPRWCRCG
jgi:malonate-semialdehyde dehydrogenase (acetylating)/methylmalonate-semialdehyde dehydrogenase